jgi:hypothetical protein
MTNPTPNAPTIQQQQKQQTHNKEHRRLMHQKHKN